MRIGVPKEIKNHEYRVGLIPSTVRELVANQHEVYVETCAGVGIGVSDEDYAQCGAHIISAAAEVFERADMIVKVKEPQAVERAMLRDDQVLFTYLHLAPDRPQTEDLINSGAMCIAYETVTNDAGKLPLLAPMSEVAGRLSVQAGAYCLEKAHGGLGVLLGGVPGVAPGKVVVIGGGAVGLNATQMAVGLGARTVVLDRNLDVLRAMDVQFGSRVQTMFSTPDTIWQQVTDADLVIGGVLIPGASAPKLVTEDMVKAMRPGSVLVDVAIDQGGCFATSHPTTHDDPTFMVHDVVHYCVANMPGAVPRTSTFALNNVTTPFVLALANKGAIQALQDDPHLRAGLNVYKGKITCPEVAEALALPYTPPEPLLTLA